MAIKWPLANGVWSNAANWNDGTLPDVGDDVYADGKTVTIDQDVTVLSIRNDQRSGGTNGGGFLIGSNLNSYTIIGNLFVTLNITLLTSSVNNITLNLIGNITMSGNFNVQNSITFSSSNSILNITGNIEDLAVVKVQDRQGVGILGSNNIINITGSILSRGNGGTNTYIVRLSGNHIEFNFIGNIEVLNSTSALNINGLVTNGVNIIGQAKAGFNHCVVISQDTRLTITKSIGGLTKGFSGVTGIGTIIVSEIENTFNGGSGIGTGNIRWANDSIKIIGYRANGTQFILSDGIGDANFIPNPANVRSGITYNLDQNTGTLVLPTEDNVRKGVVYDNFDKTGTADLTAEDFNQVLDNNIQNLAEGILQAIQDSTTPLAERLRNVSTVQTTGDQISTI